MKTFWDKYGKQVGVLLGFLFLVGVISITFGFAQGKEADHYKNMGVALIIAWVIFLLAYYTWAIHFYNVNYGWTDEEWKINAERKGVAPELVESEPDSNPHAGESLGLPPGTIRATIALSLLVAGLSMTIASLSMKNTYPADAVFVDNFEFFKNAFLMMIAFYFGVKGLEILDKNYKTNTSSPATKETGTPSAETPSTIATGTASPSAKENTSTALPTNVNEAKEAQSPLRVEGDIGGQMPKFDHAAAKG